MFCVNPLEKDKIFFPEKSFKIRKLGSSLTLQLAASLTLLNALILPMSFFSKCTHETSFLEEELERLERLERFLEN